MAGGGEGVPSLAELFPLHSPCSRCKAGLGTAAPETGLGWSGAKAASGEGPPSRATLPSTLRSQMHLGMCGGTAGYKDFAVCLGQRRKLGVEGGEYGESADKIPGMQQKKWKKEIYRRRRTLLIALVKCKRGGRNYDVCWQGRKSSQNWCISAVRERTVLRAITFPRYTPV